MIDELAGHRMLLGCPLMSFQIRFPSKLFVASVDFTGPDSRNSGLFLNRGLRIKRCSFPLLGLDSSNMEL